MAVRREGFEMVIGDLARLNAARYRNKTAFKDERREISFELVNRRMNAFTRSLLDRGLEKGDRIAVLLHNYAMSPLPIICPKQDL